MCTTEAAFKVLLGWLLGPVALFLWDRIRDTVECSFKLWFCWVVEKAATWLRPRWDASIAALPSLPQVDLSWLGSALGVVNTWVPLTEAAFLSLGFLGIYTGWVVYRNVKSWIPTLAG